jgi:universal stress protein E
MKRLDRILAVIDPTTDAQPALAKGHDARAPLRGDAGAVHLRLRPVAVRPAVLRHGQAAAAARGIPRERLEYLEEAADDLRAGGLAVETHVHWDNPLYRGIVRRVTESAPDLVVKDTHYHTTLRRTLFTNTDWNLIRTCPAPILLAKGGDWPAVPRILAALDPGHLGDKPAALDHDILEWGELFAARMGGELHAVHAFFPAALLAATTTMAGCRS